MFAPDYWILDMTKVLFVCLGNICRSPMAEAVFSHKVKEEGLNSEIEVDSCGTAAYHIGQDPDPRTVAIVTDNNIPINHTVRQLRLEDFNRFDYILAMDRSNLSEIYYVKPDDSLAEIMLIRDFDPTPGDGQVPDPYYGGNDGFQNVFEMLDRSSNALLKHIKR